MNVWLGIKDTATDEAIKLVSDYCSNHEEVEGSYIIELVTCENWSLLKIYFSDACYDCIYPEEFAESSNEIEELFIARCFEGSASAQVRQVFKKGELQLQLDLLNEESKFLSEYKKYEEEFGDIPMVIEKNEDIFKMDSDDEDDDGQYLQLTYQTLKFDTSTNNSNSINNNNDYDNNNNNNSNNSNNNNNNKINSHFEEFEEESGYEKLLYYNNETIRSKSMESSTTHVYASLEETIAEYSTSSADWSDSNVYEYVI